MTERNATIASRVGLHARPAAIFAEAAGEFDLEITIARLGEPVDEAMDAASILSLVDLGASHGEVVVLRARATAPTPPWNAWSRSSKRTTTPNSVTSGGTATGSEARPRPFRVRPVFCPARRSRFRRSPRNPSANLVDAFTARGRR